MHLHNIHVSSLLDISSDINDIVEIFSCLIKNASFGASVRLNPRVHQKKKRKHNKVWHDDECKMKLRHVKRLGRILTKSPWNTNLRLKVLYEKIQYNKILRNKYRNYKSKSLNFMLDASENNPTEFGKILNSFKEKSEDPSTSISPQD